jgi:hypothetical protein
LSRVLKKINGNPGSEGGGENGGANTADYYGASYRRHHHHEDDFIAQDGVQKPPYET